MKRLLPVTAFVLLASATLLSVASSNKKATPPATGTALVELFTSEGCSSCPPADEAVAEAAKAHPGNVLVLCFHVDYWDRLGWKDAYSNAAWTARQNHYAEQMKLSSIYTPEAIVNGKTEFTGSDRNRLNKTIDQALKSPAPAPLALEAREGKDRTITVSYKLAALTGQSLNVALVQRNADTEVKKGENEGKRLHHINIVRDLRTMPATSGGVVLHLPAGLGAADCEVIAFVQNNNTLAISAAAQASIH
ncbi:MAG TPA: DUF1223 domain-containing protein [Chitinophagaceae bacterium]